MTASAVDAERVLVERILAGDSDAFAALVDRFCAPMSRLAGAILGDPTHVPDALQETWIAVLAALPSFEWRASLKTWLLRILSNRTRTLAGRLGRDAHATLDEDGGGEDEPAVDPARFSRFGWWREPPCAWPVARDNQEEALMRKELRALVMGELEALPPRQRAVVMLRDVEELSADETCAILGLSEENQRVLLHRGRSRLRTAVERKVAGT
jgi:RNA polymerase sigma-70 factor (ECF subfamily)